MEGTVPKTPALSETGKAVGLLSRSLFEDSVREGGPRIRDYGFREPCDAMHAMVNVLGIAGAQWSASRGRAYLGSIKEGLQYSVPETSSQEARQTLRAKADGAARLLLFDADLARHIANAFVARKEFTSLEKRNLAEALDIMLEKADLANLFAGKRG